MRYNYLPLLKLFTHLDYIFKGLMKAGKKIYIYPIVLSAPLFTFHLPPKIFHASTKYRFRSKKEIEVYFLEIQRNLCTNFGVGFRPWKYRTLSFKI